MELPKEFTTYTKELMGDERYAKFLAGMEQEPPTSIRLNPFKCPQNVHVTEEVEEQKVPWCPSTGRFLSTRRNFTFDPLLHAGLYYVQEAASMLVDRVVRQYIHKPIKMLDLCAAPGGKSTALRSALPQGSLLFSNEPMRTRSQILAENLQKFGHPDVIVTNSYPHDYKKAKLQFDAILTDVPCSGEGMFRKDEGSIKEWSTQNVTNCWKLQREIVSDIWDCLKPGGILIYSTCTFNAHEDEENVDWIMENLGAELLSISTEPSWNITGSLVNSEPMYHFIPGISRGEGLFLAVLRKEGKVEEEREKKGKDKKNKKEKGSKARNSLAIPNNWLNNDREWCYQHTENGIYAIDAQWKSILDEATKSLQVIHAGIKVANMKGKDLIPDQSLALSTEINKERFQQIELSYEDAINYLRKEAVILPPHITKGYVLATYKNIPIGWMKNIGNRANNLYPQEWKIKSSHIPEGNNNIIEW